jgi:YHS domain-containing protein
MIRVAVYLLLAIIIISLLRSIIGIVAKGFGSIIDAGSSSPEKNTVSQGGELKRDPVCGTYVSTATAVQKNAAGQTHYFCSAECRDKFKTASRA